MNEPHNNQQGQHTVGETCSSGCTRYSNREEARAAQRGYHKGTATTPPRKRRAARKQARQNRKG